MFKCILIRLLRCTPRSIYRYDFRGNYYHPKSGLKFYSPTDASKVKVHKSYVISFQITRVVLASVRILSTPVYIRTRPITTSASVLYEINLLFASLESQWVYRRFDLCIRRHGLSINIMYRYAQTSATCVRSRSVYRRPRGERVKHWNWEIRIDGIWQYTRVR